jgi:menaquinone-specific isochorismate synthase
MEPTRSEGQSVRAELGTGVVRGCPVESVSLRSFLRALDRPRLAWAGGVTTGTTTETDTTDATTVAAGGAAATVTTSGRDRFATVRARAQAVFDRLTQVDSLPGAARPRLYGGFAFTDRHDADTSETWTGYPGARFVLPAVQLAVTPEGPWLTTAALGPGARETATRRLETWRGRLAALPDVEPGTSPGVCGLEYNPAQETWREQVGRATDRIERGDLKKVVLAQSLTARLDRPAVPGDVLARLAEPYPDCHRFLFEPRRGGAFFGATPERLVSVRGDTVETEALAGSIGRGKTDAEDDRLAAELLDSPKNTHEHSLVVDAIRDQLGAMTTDIETGERTVRRLATVQHIQTPIRARLREEAHVLSLVEALHPTPAVGGLPPDEALQTIRETEAFDRGWYAAPVGWLDAEGNGTFAVAIRSGIARGRRATLFAGAGIVPDSDPDTEWDELQLKYRPILDELA